MLDTYFKQYFWTFHLAVLAAAGYLVAHAANIFIGDALRIPATAIAESGGAGGAVSEEHKSNASTVPVTALLERNVFQAQREDLTPPDPTESAAEAAAQQAIADVNNCEKSALRTNLVATVVASRDDHSVAVFVDPAKNAPEAHYVGDKVLEQATILSIAWREVKVDNAGKCERFSIEEEEEAGAAQSPVAALPQPAAPPTTASGAPEMDLGKGVKKVTENEFEIPRSEIDNVLGNLNVVATQARIVPSFQNGKANGFKLFSIRPGSLYSKIGIQNGDVIQKINGYEINSPDKALEIYSKLKDAQQITVDLVRQGRAKTLSYQIR